MPASKELIHMHESQMMVGNPSGALSSQVTAQVVKHGVDVRTSAMENASQERRRTVVALVSASIISLVVWGLIIVLNVH